SVSEPYIRKIGKDGRIRTIAGNGTTAMEEGVLAIETGLEGVSAHSLAVDVEGNLYYGSRDIGIIWKIGKDGILRRIAGTGVALGGFNGDNIAAASANINIDSLVVAPDGAIYVADALHGRGRVIGLPLPGFSDTERVVPSEDGSEIYVFDSSGKHLRTQNTLTGTVVHDFTYDLAERLITVVDGNGNSTSIQRDVSGNPTSITGPDGQVTLLFLNANGYLSDVINPNNESYSMVYTAKGLITQFTNPRNNTSTFTYNAEGRMLTDTDAAGGSQTLARMETDDSYTVTNTSGLGRVSSFSVETLATGGKNLRTVTGPSGFSTVTLLGLDNSQTITSPDGTVTNITKNPDPRFGMLAPLSNLAVTTPGGIVSTLTTTRSVTLADPADPLSLTAMVDMLILNGRPFASVYDAALLKFTDTTPEGRVTTSFTDTQGRIIQEQVPGLSDTDFFYDVRGRLTDVRQGAAGPNQRLSSIAYDGNGFVASVTDPLNRAVQFEYDLAGRVTKQILPDLKEINFVYDTNGNVVSITPPGRPAHVFQYNKTDLETEYRPPAIGLPEHRTLFTYNVDKQLTTITRPDGQTVAFTYEPGGRVASFAIPRGTTSFSYDALTGNVNNITAPDGGAQSFTYDGSLLLSTTWAGTVAGSVARTYDNDFRITSRSVNGGSTIAFGYDNDSLLTSAGTQTLAYDPTNGLLTDSTLGVVTDNYGYNGFAEVTSYDATVSATSVFNTTSTRDKLGRITQKVETAQGVARTYDYFYDFAGRLIAVNRDGVLNESFTYDSNGNKTNNGATYDDQDRLTSTLTASYTYTDNGELLSKTDASGTTTYAYDVLGNLLSVDVANGSLIEYIVDASNRRIGRKVDGTLDKGWLYKDQLNPVAELDGAGNIVSRFVYASRANIPDYIIKGGNTYRIISDHLGSPRLVVDVATGLVAQAMDFDEFGNVLADTNPGFQPFGFAGGLYDASTKLTRFGARDYDPEIGRWTSKDPILFAGGDSNLYGYTFNNPINFIDPIGLWFVDIGFSGAAKGEYGPGGTIGLKISPDGVFGYFGFGLGIGQGVSATYNPFGDISEGVSVDASVRGGRRGIGAQAGGSFNKDGFSGTWGVGFGIGFGGSIAVTDTVKLFDFSIIKDFFNGNSQSGGGKCP
ncbi:MAG: hypothetical protein JKY23_02495, partial [Nitrospinaceae bacterium]|nr:hypothetical protein [Nitrospinaceae bacterium]